MSTQKINSVSFGKHKHVPFDKIPKTYLEWYVKNYNPEDRVKNKSYSALERHALYLYAMGKDPEEEKRHCTHFHEAFRNEVHDDIKKFREQEGYTGKGLEFHVGHTGEQEFHAIKTQFIIENNLSNRGHNVELNTIKRFKGFDTYMFANRDLAEKWRIFHLDKAVLVMQTALENLTSVRQKVEPAKYNIIVDK